MIDETNLEDIVFLRNIGYHTDVIKFTDKGLKEPALLIDVKSGTWSYSEWKNIPIGEARQVQGDRTDKGVLGVYNIKYFEHIRSMINAAVKFSQEPPNYMLDQ